MKPNFALDLSHEGINLLHRSKGGWTLVGSVALDDSDVGARLDEMHRSAAMLESGGLTTKVIIPDSQILYTTLAAPGPDDISREVQIRAALDGLTPYPVGELVFDWRAQGDEARVAVLARETMDEAEGFAAEYKFNPVSFVARPARGEFSGEPFFGKTRAASRLLAPGERIEPDASPVPANPKAKELPPEARVATAEEASDAVPAPGSTPELTPDPAPVPEPVVDPVPDSVTPDAMLGDPFADFDQPGDDSSGGDGDDMPREPRPKRPRRSADAGARVSAPVLAPFPPTPDEEGEASMPTPRPVPQISGEASGAAPVAPVARPSAPVATPPAPSPPETPSGGEAPADSPDDASADVPFASTRKMSAAPKPTGSESPAPRVASALPANGGSETSAAPSVDRPAAKPATPPSSPPVRTLAPEIPAGPVDRIRADMADALAKPLPRPGTEPLPKEKSPGVLARLANGVGSGRSRADTAPGNEAADTGAAAPKPSRGGFLGLGRRSTDADEKRSREAEALTVFGERRAQASAGRPKYLGLILTLVLVLLMGVVAIWSSSFVDDGDVSLFNPGPEVTTDPTPPATETTEAQDPETETVAPPTAEVLSPDAAEARYAATGIWQRAPETPSDPETARLDNLDIAGLSPVTPNREPPTLPAPSNGGLREAALADPVPPPPPGTTFDLDENGLVVATPEGALSPTGILVFSGRPAVVPPTPPAGLFPEPAAAPEAVATADETPAAVVPLDIPRVRPPVRPEGLVPPAPAEATPVPDAAPDGAAAPADGASLIRPTPRPGTLPPETDTAAIDAVVENVIEATLVNATELAVERSTLPSHRPQNFASIVDSAQASASDGSSVIAASAVVTPSIPTSANVATRATTENALNMREINLIGIYGSSNSRRALVRLKSGRYVKVETGDRLDGGKVTSISASRLTYQRGSRAYTLEVLPLG